MFVDADEGENVTAKNAIYAGPLSGSGNSAGRQNLSNSSLNAVHVAGPDKIGRRIGQLVTVIVHNCGATDATVTFDHDSKQSVQKVPANANRKFEFWLQCGKVLKAQASVGSNQLYYTGWYVDLK